jgi:hypothetical protein
MDENSYVFEVVAGVLYALVGGRLWLLSRQTRQRPEQLIGLTFLLWGGSYLIYNFPFMLESEALVTPFFFSGRISYDLGTVAITLFTRRVFRPNARWGGWIVIAIVAFLIVGIAGSATVGDWEGVEASSNPWFWCEWAGISLPLIWFGIEAAIQYSGALRRSKLGLCNRFTCNQFLLWSLAGFFMIGSNIAFIFQYFEYERAAHFSGAMDALVGLFEIFTIGVIWLVFFPPDIYRNRFTVPEPTPETTGTI